MPTVIDGSTGVSKVQDNTITSDNLVTAAKVGRCKAWVNFDGTLTGTITPKASFNVASVVKNATGDYTINFITPMTDVNYVVAGSGQSGTTGGFVIERKQLGTWTVSAAQILIDRYSAGPSDLLYVGLVFFGN